MWPSNDQPVSCAAVRPAGGRRVSMSAGQPEHRRDHPVDVGGVFVVGEQRLVDEMQPAIQHGERDPVRRRVVADGADDVAQQRGLTGLGVAEHHQQRVLGEVEYDCGQVLFALADDDPLRRRRYSAPTASGARLVGSNRTGGAAMPG